MASGTATVNGTFTMTENGATTILVDFDGEASISQSGSTYAMTPVVRLVSVQ
jgi:hypothetical protein